EFTHLPGSELPVGFREAPGAGGGGTPAPQDGGGGPPTIVPQKKRRTTVVITEVRIKLMEDNNERLQAFCSVTFDDAFVVRDLKIIEGAKGSFVAMPSRKLTDRCPNCGCKNHLRANYCNQCAHKLDADRAVRDPDGRAKLHADIAHPINSACREVMQGAILKSYTEERERAKQPGYVTSRHAELIEIGRAHV